MFDWRFYIKITAVFYTERNRNTFSLWWNRWRNVDISMYTLKLPVYGKIFGFFSEVFGNLRSSSKIFGNIINWNEFNLLPARKESSIDTFSVWHHPIQSGGVSERETIWKMCRFLIVSLALFCASIVEGEWYCIKCYTVASSEACVRALSTATY